MTIHKINLINEKLHVANILINGIETDLLNNKILTHNMLKNLVEKCNELLINDF